MVLHCKAFLHLTEAASINERLQNTQKEKVKCYRLDRQVKIIFHILHTLIFET